MNENNDMPNLTYLEQVDARIEAVNDNVELILQAIKGNPITGDGGLIRSIRIVDAKIDRQEEVQKDFKKEVEQKFTEVNERFKPIDTFMVRFNWTIVIILSVASFLGTVIGLAIAFFSLKK